MDAELFELCKEAYERTKWRGQRDWFRAYKTPSGGTVYELKPDAEDSSIGDHDIPLYDSDYLLEKLRNLPCDDKEDEPYIDLRHGGVSKPEFRWDARANLGLDRDYEVDADTPLKALLNLTIGLHDAGVPLNTIEGSNKDE